jgi:phosphate-selective porin
VDIDVRTAYVLATVGGERVRFSGRYDVFRNFDRDHTAEPDDDDGHAWTAAVLWSPARRVRLAVEAVRVVATRPAAPVDTGGRRFSGELRIGF